MNSKRLHRVRSYFTAIFGAITILGVIAFAPKADASDCNFKYRPNFRFAYETNQRAIERAEVRERERADALDRYSFGYRLWNRPVVLDHAIEPDKPKKPRRGIFARFTHKF